MIMSDKAASAPVTVGQVWRDNDVRAVGRLTRDLKITAVGETHANADVFFPYTRSASAAAAPPRTTRVRIDRFKPTPNGYVLMKDVAP